MNASAADLVQRADALREAQCMEEALEAITRAVELNPNDPRALFGLAQIRFETWRPAADDFARAIRHVPDHPDLIRNHAMALAAESDIDAACEILRGVLHVNPGWIDGHKALSTLQITSGRQAESDQSYKDAVRADPNNLSLHMAWFQHHAVANNWDNARRIIDNARRLFGANKNLDLAELFIASESGERDVDFSLYSDLGDPGTDLCHVRYLLRMGEYAAAQTLANIHIGLPTARIFWPYLSLCWRLTKDKRADWLDDTPTYARIFDLDFSPLELAHLANVLRGLHRMKSPYPEQSVRSGTQTDRQIFFNPDVHIQAAKTKIVAAVQRYIDSLPSNDKSHPMLSQNRDTAPLFEGSWSVRLRGAGYHSSHTHVKGWISSAFYIALPEQSEAGPDKAGWLALGSPPPELGLDLTYQMTVEPKPARLVLFPSTTWHSTRPISAGERLTVAFDVRLPA